MITVLHELPGDKVRVRAPRCQECGGENILDLPKKPVMQYLHGAMVQQAFPEMSPEEREVLITGIHPACWVAFIGVDPDDEEL